VSHRAHPSRDHCSGSSYCGRHDARQVFSRFLAAEKTYEHILGGKWPSAEIRQEKLEEAVRIIRMLWEGGVKSHRGRYFKVENAQVFTLPKEVPPIFIAAGGDKAATVAAKIADVVITAGEEEKVIKTFYAAGGKRKPRYSQVTVCWAKSEKQAAAHGA
jgi:coenzyme F420-dependent glucose-6-phosphate dehydrogenase